MSGLKEYLIQFDDNLGVPTLRHCGSQELHERHYYLMFNPFANTEDTHYYCNGEK